MVKIKEKNNNNFFFHSSHESHEVMKTELGSSDQVASLSADKNTGVVLVLFRALKYVSTAISGGVDISEVPGCHLLQCLSEGHKNYFKDWCLMNSQPT